MSLTQHRRSVSVSPRGYLELESLAEHWGLSKSRMVERLVADACKDAGVEVDQEEVRALKAQRKPMRRRNEKRLAKRRAECFGPQADMCRYLPCCFCRASEFKAALRVLEASRMTPQALGWVVVSDAHHVKTRGAGGRDDVCAPTCSECHGEIHSKGLQHVVEKYDADPWRAVRMVGQLVYGQGVVTT